MSAGERLFTRPFLWVAATNFAQGLAFNLFLHLPRYLHQLGASDVEIGLITSLTGLAAVLVRPPVGRAMDRRGRRVVILWGGALNVLALGGYLAVREIGPALYLVRVLHGVAEALLFSSLFTYAADHVPARIRTQGLALFGVSGMLPIALGGTLGDAILAAADFRALFWIALALSVASLAASLALAEAPRARPGPGESASVRETFLRADLQPLWWIGGIFSLVLTAFFVFVRRFVDETGIGSVALFFNAYTASALCVRVFAGWLPERVGPKRVLFPALALLCVGFAGMALATRDAHVLAAGALCGVGHGYTFPILFALVVNRTPDAQRGVAMAIFTALSDLGLLLGGPLFGGLVEAFGFSSMYAVAGAALAFGLAVFAVWDPRALAQRAGVLLLVLAGLGCQAPALAPGAPSGLEPYFWPRNGRLSLLACRWTTATPVGVATLGATAEEDAAVDRALRAVEASGLGVHFARAPWPEASLQLELVDDPVPLANGALGTGRSLVDCQIEGEDPLRGGLALARVTLARRTPPDARGRVRELDDAERTGALLHELGHALGFQGHAAGDDPLARETERVRRWGERVLAGEPFTSPALAALYARPEPLTVLAAHPVGAERTHLVDRMQALAARERVAGPFLRTGDGAARIFWRDASGREYGIQVHEPRSAARSPAKLLLLPERATREALPRANDPRGSKPR